MFLILLFMGLLLSSCFLNFPSQRFTCVECHSQIKFSHAGLTCSDCHLGKEKAKNKKEAHLSLRKNLNVREIEQICQRCHSNEIKEFKKSIHYTYERELKTIFKGFKMDLSIKKLEDLPKLSEDISTKEGLLIDFLKRRCLNCHLFSDGEDYKETKRRLGCLSCHNPHTLRRSEDKDCLTCHYSSRIGWDYYGFFPHNWFTDYRSPFIEGKLPDRPYGIESYLLEEDIHKKKNMKCIDCHKKREIMEGKEKIRCQSCHITFKSSIFHTSKILNQVHCTLCHANFMVQDSLKICYLEENPDLEAWIDLAVQESSEIEEKIQSFLKGDKVKYTMKDKFTGREKKGLWLCTLGERTFENLTFGKDEKNNFCLVRKERVILKYKEFEIEGAFETCKIPHSSNQGNLIRAIKILKLMEAKPKWNTLR